MSLIFDATSALLLKPTGRGRSVDLNSLVLVRIHSRYLIAQPHGRPGTRSTWVPRVLFQISYSSDRPTFQD